MKKDKPDYTHQIDEYTSRINRVLDYIEKNLDKTFTLDELAKVANFSKFHFNRIFSSFFGETLFQLIQRLRIEKAAQLLLAHPKKSITEIAHDCGFSSSATFARSFKETFKMSASEWRNSNSLAESNLSKHERNARKALRNHREELSMSSIYIETQNQSLIWRISMKNENRTVEVKELPEMTVAYVRHIGPYKGDSQLFERLFGKLCQWAGPRGFLNQPDTKYIVVYHDDPKITEEAKLRISVSLTVPSETDVDGEIGKMAIPAGKYAITRFELGPTEYGEAWNWVYGTWLPASGYVPDDRPCFEMYPPKNDVSCKDKMTVDICVPVKPL